MPIEGATETAAAVPAMTLQQHDLIVRRKQDGELTIEQYQAGFASLIASKDSRRVQIGIEPTWKNHNGPRYFSRYANEIVGRYIEVYDHDLLPIAAP